MLNTRQRISTLELYGLSLNRTQAEIELSKPLCSKEAQGRPERRHGFEQERGNGPSRSRDASSLGFKV